jgi:hypothetical protein
MGDHEFKELICLAKTGDINAVENVIEMFKPCINKNSFINGEFNEDIFQELNIELIRCIKKFIYTEPEDIWSIGGECHFED